MCAAGNGMGGLAPNAIWSQHAGGPQGDFARDLAVAGDGSVVVVGELRGTIDFGTGPLTSAGQSDIFLVRYASDGTAVHARRYGGAGVDTPHAVAIDGAGNTVVAGVCGGDAIDLGDGPVSCAVGARFLAKIDPDGNLIWKHGPSDVFAEGTSLAIDAAGDIVMVGYCSTGCDLGGGPLAGLDRDVALAKLTAAGVHVWSKRFGGNTNPDQHPTKVVLGPGGSIHIGGFFGPTAGDSTIDFGGGPLVAEGSQSLDHDAFVATFDADSAHVWSKRFGDPNATRASGLACDANGDVIVGGTLDGTVDFGGGPLATAGGNDVFVTRLDAAGNHVWSKRFGSFGSQAALDLALGPTGVIHVVGRFGGSLDFGGGALVGAGSDDGFVAGLDGAGQHLSSRRFGDACSQFAREVATDANGNVAIAGELQGPGATIDLGNGPLVSVGQEDIFVAKLPP